MLACAINFKFEALTGIDNYRPLIAADYVLELEYVLILYQTSLQIPALLPHLEVCPALRHIHVLLQLSLLISYPYLQVKQFVPSHLSRELPRILHFLRLVQHQPLIEIDLHLLVGGDSEGVQVAEVCPDHAMNHQGVLLVMISEVDVHGFIEEEVKRVHREGVLEIREVVVGEEGHGQEADSPGSDGQ